jgi:hypothetical protein
MSPRWQRVVGRDLAVAKGQRRVAGTEDHLRRHVMVTVSGNATLTPVATQARGKLRAALDALAAASGRQARQ